MSLMLRRYVFRSLLVLSSLNLLCLMVLYSFHSDKEAEPSSHRRLRGQQQQQQQQQQPQGQPQHQHQESTSGDVKNSFRHRNNQQHDNNNNNNNNSSATNDSESRLPDHLKGWMYVLPDADQFPVVGNCQGIPNPGRVRETFTWQTLAVNQTATYVFSAYYEPRLVPRAVRIIGISNGRDNVRKYCQVWYPGRTEPEVSTAESILVPETHNRDYAAVMFLCYLKDNGQIPTAVSLVLNKCDLPHNVLKVSYDRSKWRKRKNNFTVCVTPLNFNYNDTHQLVEMIEINHILGADKIVFYNYSSSANVLPYLESYQKEGLVDVIQWRLPVAVDPWPPNPEVIPMIHYFGQLAMLNECLYRYMYRSRYIVFSDLDEVIVPREASDWPAMMSSLPAAPHYGGFIVQNVFFPLDKSDDANNSQSSIVQQLKLKTLLKTYRDSYPLPWYSRSKYIVRPTLTEVVGVHFIYQYIDNGVTLSYEVAEEQALLHHYRIPIDTIPVPRLTDNIMSRYWHPLVTRAFKRHQSVVGRSV